MKNYELKRKSEKKNRVIDWSVNKALKDEYIFKMTISLLLFSLHIMTYFIKRQVHIITSAFNMPWLGSIGCKLFLYSLALVSTVDAFIRS